MGLMISKHRFADLVCSLTIKSITKKCPVSLIVEHSTDNRKTEERYLYWIPY